MNRYDYLNILIIIELISVKNVNYFLNIFKRIVVDDNFEFACTLLSVEKLWL